MKLYHKDVFIPAEISAKLPAGQMLLNYGSHARQEALLDRYGKIDLPQVLDFSKFEVIEIGAENGRIKKVLVRGQLDDRRDICIVVVPSSRFVKTVWINLRSDKHKTLDVSKYEVA